MSSDTVLFDAAWNDGGQERHESLVARIAPDAGDVPVFPDYELSKQFEVLRIVRELTSVPVPKVWWYEPDPEAMGAPFFVMGCVEGLVPPDVMPYTFGDNWLFDATDLEKQRLQDTTVQVLADLHGIPHPETEFSFLSFDVPGETPLRRHIEHTRQWYEFAKKDCGPSPLVERSFAWLDDHWPKEEGPTVLSWGDARIGNMMYRDFEPVAVFDWEMAGLGPRELDLSWLIFGHQVFDTLAARMELPGMPDFLVPSEVATSYEFRTGHTPANLDFYLIYAALQWGIVFMRTGMRQVHFGEVEMPDDIESWFHHRPLFDKLLGGESIV
jgi:aminoglycoside phosphotransferase (APT) family kinase protein